MRRQPNAIRMAFEGSELLNDSCADGTPDYRVYSEIGIHKPEAVHEIAQKLIHLPVELMAKTEPALRAAYPNRELPSRFDEYVREFGYALVNFYRAASASGQAVVSWND